MSIGRLFFQYPSNRSITSLSHSKLPKHEPKNRAADSHFVWLWVWFWYVRISKESVESIFRMLLPSFSLNCNLRNLLFKHKRLFTGVISAGLSLSNDCNVLILPDSSTVSSVLGSPSKDTLLTILWARWSASWIEINYKHWQYWQGIDNCRIRKKYNDTRNTTSASCVLMFLFWQSCRFPVLAWGGWLGNADGIESQRPGRSTEHHNQIDGGLFQSFLLLLFHDPPFIKSTGSGPAWMSKNSSPGKQKPPKRKKFLAICFLQLFHIGAEG